MRSGQSYACSRGCFKDHSLDVGVEETKAIDHLHFTNRGVGLHDLLESLQEAGVWSGQETVFLS